MGLVFVGDRDTKKGFSMESGFKVTYYLFYECLK